MRVTDADDEPVRLSGVEDAVVKRSKLANPGNNTAVFVFNDSHNVRVVDNKLVGGELNFDEGTDFTAIGNQIINSAGDGITTTLVARVLFRENTIDNTEGVGIKVSGGASDVRVSSNELTSTDTGGITVLNSAAGVRIANNTVTLSAADGILVQSGTDAELSGNTAKSSSDDGIHVDDTDTLIVDNRANANDQNGIDSDSANGSGNVAKNNDVDPQCTPASLCA
jgi:parallel beta-helix repeat protein